VSQARRPTEEREVADGPDVVLVRHGETEWSLTGQHTGKADIPLTPRGEAQARDRLGSILGRRRFARVLASPLSRARETARLAGFPDAEVLDDLREWDYGAYEGRTTVDIQAEMPGWTPWTHPMVGGESLEELGARCDRVLKVVDAVGDDVVLFAHGHFLRVLAARWCTLPASEGRRLLLDTATVGVLSRHHDLTCIRHWNVTEQIQT